MVIWLFVRSAQRRFVKPKSLLILQYISEHKALEWLVEPTSTTGVIKSRSLKEEICYWGFFPPSTIFGGILRLVKACKFCTAILIQRGGVKTRGFELIHRSKT